MRRGKWRGEGDGHQATDQSRARIQNAGQGVESEGKVLPGKEYVRTRLDTSS